MSTKDIYCRSGKISHQTKGDALAHLRSARRSRLPNVGGLHVYRCPFCSDWHVGHAKPVMERPDPCAS